MYDGKSQLLIENPIYRHLINSPILPSPDDTACLVMRLYWPKTEALPLFHRVKAPSHSRAS